MCENPESQPLVSVILPVYNGGTDLSLAIQSIEKQTYQNWELVLMDDGSTDGSLELMKGLEDKRIKLFSDGVNKGLSKRLNEAVLKSKGKYIARMDADDIAFPERLENKSIFLKTIRILTCLVVEQLHSEGMEKSLDYFPSPQIIK